MVMTGIVMANIFMVYIVMTGMIMSNIVMAYTIIADRHVHRCAARLAR